MRGILLSRKSQTLNLHLVFLHFSFPRPPISTRSTFFRQFRNIKTITSAIMSHRSFQLKLDPLTGNHEWVVIEEREEEEMGRYSEKSGKALLATTSYLDMLNDNYRNVAYHQAIRNTINRPCHVLDIGAGTGLLSMMAARAMEEYGEGEGKGKVTAFESYLPMGKLMRKVLRVNGMEKKVRLVHKRSDEVDEVGVDIDSRADVLVSEILDSELLGEGLIPTLQHAHDVLLVPNPQTVPYRATIYGQLVESTFLRKLHDLYSGEVEASDGIHLVPFGLETIMGIEPKQYAMHCSAILKELKLLSEPFRIFDFEFYKRPETRREVDLHVGTIKDGVAHAIVSWWLLQFDNTGKIFYSTAPEWIRSSNIHDSPEKPGCQNWCDHWKQCVWFIPGPGIPVPKCGHILFQAIQNIASISFSLKSAIGIIDSHCGDGQSQIILPPERIGIYGDKDHRKSFLEATSNAVRTFPCNGNLIKYGFFFRNPVFCFLINTRLYLLVQLQVKDSPLCLVADDSLFLTIALAHLSRTAHILSSFPGLKEKASYYIEAVSSANGIAKGRIEVLGKRASCLSRDDLSKRKIDLLVGEPFYYGNEGALPWQNLRFWKERTLLGSFLSEDALIMPCKAILKACAMYLPDLWCSRCGLKDIEGFDHTCANEMLGACNDECPSFQGSCLPYFIWQCGTTKELSEAFPIMDFNFSEPIHQCFGKTKIPFMISGVCHGFVLWIDWVLDEKNTNVLSTGPASRYWKQGVKLLSKPIAVNSHASCSPDEYSSAEIETLFNPSTGELDVKCNFIAEK